MIVLQFSANRSLGSRAIVGYTRLLGHTAGSAPDAVLGFNRNWQEDDSWECTELVAWCHLQKCYPLLRADKVARITPPMLALSPLLEPVT